MQQPMDLVELRLHLAKHLDLDSRKACARVCKAWHLDFQPFVWQCFTAENPPSETTLQEECLDSIRRNIHWIQHLRCLVRFKMYSVSPAIYDLLARECRSLVSLHLQVDENVQWDRCQSLLQRNTATLRRVNVRFQPLEWPRSKDISLAKALRSLLYLQKLEVFNSALSVSDILDLLEHCPGISSMVLKFHTDPTAPDDGEALSQAPTPTPSDLPPFRVKTFEMDGPCHDPALVTLLARCPSLERLHLGLLSESVRDDMCQVFWRRQWPNLTSLGLESSIRHPLYLVNVLKSIQPHQLTKIDLWHPQSNDVRDLVEYQYQSLEEVKIDIPGGEEASLVYCLSKCHRLKRLRFVDEDVGVEIRHTLAQPWVCTQLEHLDVSFSLDTKCTDSALLNIASAEKEAVASGREEHEQAMILFTIRLGQLTQLRSMSLQPGYYLFTDPPQPLPWSLSNGLVHLAGLNRLESLDFGVMQNLPLGIPELQFMKENWISLRYLASGGVRSTETKQWLRMNWPTLNAK